jgi:hypothetical protein
MDATARPADAVLPELLDAVAHLASFDRSSASPGERRAAEWIAERLRDEGCAVRVEEERAHGGYWWPLGLLTGLAGLAALSGRRPVALVAGAATAAAVADDVSGGRLWFRRRFLPSRPTWNVVAEAGEVGAARTVVVVAHHDAAHSGIVFTPAVGDLVAERFPALVERTDTTAPVMAPVLGGPLLVALWGLLGGRRLRAAASVLSLGAAATFAEIGARPTVPGANDNLSGVATLLGIARLLHERPVAGLRVLLVSTGSEESFMEGMQAFARRHFPALPRESTHVITVDTVGSPQLVQLEGEGMIRMRDYPAAFKDLVAECAATAGVPLRRGLRFRNATDGLIALRAGYPTVMLGSVDPRTKLPSNYHWPTDTAQNVDGRTIADAVTLCTAVIRRLSDDE